MNDRDTFAAAALTGFSSQLRYGSVFNLSLTAKQCYELADAMLRKRCRSGGDCLGQDNAPNLDAAPAARAGDAGAGDTQSFDAYRRFVGEVMNWISEATGFLHDDVLRTDDARDIITDACSRCWDAFDRIAYPTDHGASPEARASGDSDRADKAAPRPSEGTGDTPDSPQPIACSVFDRSQPIAKPTPVHTPPTHAAPGDGSVRREGTEPVAWGVANGSRVLATSISRMDAVDMQGDYAYHTEIVPLYREPTLTDAEREALERTSIAYELLPTDGAQQVSATLRGLLGRLGGGE